MTYNANEVTHLEPLEPRLLLSGSMTLSELAASAAAFEVVPFSQIQLTDRIETPGQSDMYEFVAAARSELTIDMIALEQGLDPYLRLYKLQNGRLRTVRRNNNAARGTRDSRVTYTVEPGQTYFVRPMGRGKTIGDYQLCVNAELVDDAGNTFDTALPTRLSRSGRRRLRGSIDYGSELLESQLAASPEASLGAMDLLASGDIDVFQFTATKTGIVTVEQSARSRRETFFCALFAYNADMELLAADEDCGVDGNALVRFEVVAGELYYIEVAKPDGQTGDYRLKFRTVRAPVNRSPVLERIGDKVVFVDAALTFTVSATDRDGDVLSYSASNLPAGATFDRENSRFSWTPTSGQVGPHGGVRFEVTDGVKSSSEEIAISVALPPVNEPPILDPIGNRGVEVGSVLNFTVAATDPDGDALSYAASNLPAGSTFNPETGVFSWSPASKDVGLYEGVHFEASDGEFSSSENIAITVAAPNGGPVMDPIGNKIVEAGSVLTFTVAATDPDGDAVSYSASNLPAGATFDTDTGVFTWTPTSGQVGLHEGVRFEASDGAHVSSEAIAIIVAAANEAPALNPIGNRIVEAGTLLTFTVTATDPDGDALSYSVSNLPAGATFDPETGVFAWTPVLEKAEALYAHVSFEVSDGELSDSEEITILVFQNPPNGAPVLDGIGDKSVQAGSLLTFTISATDPDGDAVSYSASNLPAGATLDTETGVFTWTPVPAQAGLYEGVHFEASDGELTDSQEVAISVVAPAGNEAPVLSTISDRSVSVGETLTFTVSATDPDGDVLSYSASNLPAGATFDPDTQVFSWTPSADQVGPHEGVEFSVSDGGLSDTETITITVADEPTNQAPVLQPIHSRFVEIGSTLSFAISATDPDGDALTYSAWDLPAGATFDSETQSFSWTPTVDQVGIHSGVRFEVSDGQLTDCETISINVSADPTTYVALGRGLTNAYYIDADSDGYGVASPLGPDADDDDPAVNTAVSMLATYGSLENWLLARGYPTEVVEFTPATYSRAALEAVIEPGMTVVFREGTYTDGTYPVKVQDLHASAGAPLVLLAYPGEKAVIDANGSCISIARSSHVIVDGLVLANSAPDEGKGIGTSACHDITIRNIEGYGHKWEWAAFASSSDPEPLYNLLMEGSVLHDSSQEHGIYLGSRGGHVNYNITIRDNLIYRRGRHGFQQNGPVTNLIFERNIVHTNNLGGLSLINGVCDSVIRNNLIFNNNKQGIVFYIYDTEVNHGILPFSQTGNLVENNTIWVGRDSWNGAYNPVEYSPIAFSYNVEDPSLYSMAGNTIRNNILVSYDGPTFHTEKIADVTGSVIENNIIWKRTDGAWPKDHQIVRAEDTDGSHTSSSPDGATYFWYYWDIDGLNGLADASNNLLADPQFADVSWDYYLSPEHFDFTVQATSPAIDHAAGAEGPSDDLRGELRTGELDAGCYLL